MYNYFLIDLWLFFLGSHELCLSFGCFDSSDTQLSVIFDGDEVFYVDFKKELIVWDSGIPFYIHVSWAYEYSAIYRYECKGELYRWKPDKSLTAKTKGKY